MDNSNGWFSLLILACLAFIGWITLRSDRAAEVKRQEYRACVRAAQYLDHTRIILKYSSAEGWQAVEAEQQRKLAACEALK